MTLRDVACIVGVGQTDYSKKSGRSVAHLASQAALAAAEDAGLPASAIDGILPSYPSASAEDLALNLGLADLRYAAVMHMGGASTVASLQSAAMAVNSGVCDYALVLRARNGYSGGGTSSNLAMLLSAAPAEYYRRDFELPYGLSSPMQYYALWCARHMATFGTTREQLGAVALAHRANAQLNPRAIMHDRALSMSQYLAGRPIVSPFHLFDCCLESDGAAAAIVTTPERAADLTSTPVRIMGVAESHPQSPADISNRTDFLRLGVREAARRAFGMAGVTPADLDAYMIYDCFTFVVLRQLEEIGVCGDGDGGAYVEDGNIAIGGKTPVNTHGGLLSEAHISGMNHVVEAVRQLRGECGQRQVSGAELVGVSGFGEFGDGSFAVLGR